MLALTASALIACSDFYMPTANTTYRLSVRTMDLGLDGGWNLTTVPVGQKRTQKEHAPPVGKPLQWTSKFGYVAFSAPTNGFPMDHSVGELRTNLQLDRGLASFGAIHNWPALWGNYSSTCSCTVKRPSYASICKCTFLWSLYGTTWN